MEIHVRCLLDLQERANRLMAEYTGQPYETIVQDFARDKFFTAANAQRYGFVDAIAGAELTDGAGETIDRPAAKRHPPERGDLMFEAGVSGEQTGKLRSPSWRRLVSATGWSIGLRDLVA